MKKVKQNSLQVQTLAVHQIFSTNNSSVNMEDGNLVPSSTRSTIRLTTLSHLETDGMCSLLCDIIPLIQIV